MGGKIKDLLGERFGRLVVVEFAGIKKGRVKSHTLWLCECDCGNSIVTRADTLKNGTTKSCGCLLKETVPSNPLRHGYTANGQVKSGYSSLTAAKQRCYNMNHSSYPNYGGRGIKVCDRWLDKKWGYTNFINDMGPRPPGYSIERIDNDGDYEPGNCRWATRKEQMKNTRIKAK